MFFFFPYRVDRPFHMPWATIALIATNTLMFFLSVALGLEWTIDTLGFRLDMWAPLTWLSASFLHADIFHILGNMYFLWVFASVLEDALGPWRLVGIYLAGGLASCLTHGVMMVAFNPGAASIPVIGASGALAAIMGLFAVRFYRTKVKVWYFLWIFLIKTGTVAVVSTALIALWFARDVIDGIFGLVLNYSGGVANWAHLGGVAFGVGVGLLSGQVRSAASEYLAEDAQQWAASGTHDIAAAKYAQLADNDPANPEWRRCKGRELASSVPPAVEQATSEFREAVRLFASGRQPAEAYDTFIEADGLLGQIELDATASLAVAAEAERRGEWVHAERLYMKVIDSSGGTPAAEKALFRLAHVYLGAGQRDRAAMTWGAFHDLHPASEWNAFADPALRGLEGA